jgi:predicted transcriptional regulator
LEYKHELSSSTSLNSTDDGATSSATRHEDSRTVCGFYSAVNVRGKCGNKSSSSTVGFLDVKHRMVPSTCIGTSTEL